PLETRLRTPEDPGPWCFPPVAVSITAAARLLLAMLERLVRDHGGSSAFCATDAMALLPRRHSGPLHHRPGGRPHPTQVPALARVEEILARFDQLNPYDPVLVPRLWKVEADSTTTPLWCYSISAKRYCLYRRGARNKVAIVAAFDAGDNLDDEGSQTTTELL